MTESFRRDAGAVRHKKDRAGRAWNLRWCNVSHNFSLEKCKLVKNKIKQTGIADGKMRSIEFVATHRILKTMVCDRKYEDFLSSK
jgi:hypothetical protein